MTNIPCMVTAHEFRDVERDLDSKGTHLFQTDDSNFLFLLLVCTFLGQVVVHLATAHHHPLETLLLRGFGGPAYHQH